uniref:Glutathione transferase n=1 Tax=Paramoeba aestuarina TaxID=180227 RepID=A0A7S4PF05_9EUKA
MSEETPKLVYWKFHGRAACVRLAAIIGGVKIEDEFMSFDDFKAKKEELPFGTLPILKTSKGTICQSNAQLLYIGRQGNLVPSDPFKMAQVDDLLGLGEDFYGKISPSIREQDPEKKAAMRKELNDEVFPRMIGYVERWLKGNGNSKYFVGDEITVADLKMYPIFQWLASGKLDGVSSDLLKSFPEVSRVYNNIGDHSKVKEYYANPGF